MHRLTSLGLSRWWLSGAGVVFVVACGGDDAFFEAAKPDAGSAASGGAAGSAGSASGGSAGSAATGGSSGSTGSGGSTSGGSAGVAGASGGASGSAGAAATGGSAGAPVDGGCPDADGDGQTTCAGDCDDADASNFSGNPEVCGDARDNDCDNQPDDGCSGFGTFVSSNVGSDSNPGTQALPVATIGKGLQNAQTIGGGVDVYIGEGHYTEKVALVEGIDLLGGYQCDSGSCTWARNSRTYDSAIFATDEQGVVATDSITRATRIDGLRIMGQDGGGVGRGRVALSLLGGTPIVTNNRVMGPDVTSGSFVAGRSIGILIWAPNAAPGVLIVGNTIDGGQSSNETAIGILMEGPFPPSGSAYAEIRGNQISGGQGRSTNGIAAWASGAGTLVVGNDISAGTAGSGQAWGIAIGSEITIDNNRVNLASSPGSCAGTSYCGGIASFSATATITNNVVLGVPAQQTVGVMLMEAEKPSGEVVLNANYIQGSSGSSSGGSPSLSAAVVVRIGDCNSCGFNGKIGKLRNNVLVLGRGANRFGVYEDAPAGKTQHPVALENNLFFASASSSSSDALYRYYNGATATGLTTILQVNGLTTQIPALIVGNNLAGDPKVNASYHLVSGSPCIDKGTTTDAPPTDMDGEARPKGATIDIGPDEAQ